MSRVVRFHEFGSAEVLRLDELEPAEPGPGEVRIRVEAFALNRAEVLLRQNQYIESPALPSRLGYDAAGVVEAIGPGVHGVTPGTRVATLPCFQQSRHGVYGEWALVPAEALLEVPSALDSREASTLGVQYMTGYFPLAEIASVRPGDHVLVTAGSSSTGVAAIQLAKAFGAKVLATTRRAAKREDLLAVGADAVIVTQEQEVAPRVAETTGGTGVALAFDPVGGARVHDLVESVGRGGHVVLYGLLDPSPAGFSVPTLLGKGASIHGYTVFTYTGNAELGIAPRETSFASAKRFLLDHLANRSIVPKIARTFALDEVAEAHRFMESNEQVGKIVVTTN